VQQIKTAAVLSHLHILPLIDSGEADLVLYEVMPWMASLAVAIQTDGCHWLYSSVSSVCPLREIVMARTRRAVRRKNMFIDQRKLDAAKAALGAETETAAVDAALDLVVFRAEVFRGLDALVAAGGLVPHVRRAG
jgi:hypothetical protein